VLQETCKVLILARNQENEPQRHYGHDEPLRCVRSVVVVRSFLFLAIRVINNDFATLLRSCCWGLGRFVRKVLSLRCLRRFSGAVAQKYWPMVSWQAIEQTSGTPPGQAIASQSHTTGRT